jgi:putative ABC transport system substrate-binding protein
VQGLQELGWTDGRNIRIDTRWSAADADLGRKYAAELVALAPDVILASGGTVVGALLEASRTTPIVFTLTVDPVGAGFVASLARPGGNVTGFTLVESSIVGKWLELLKEIAPRVNRVAFLFQPAAAPYAQYYLDVFKAAAPSLGIAAIAAPINKTSEIEPVIAEQARDQNGGLILMPDTFLLGHRAEITSLAGRYALPAVYPYSNYTKVGGLVSYGYDLLDNYRRAAIYADRILRGTKPSELPVQLPVKVQLTLNLRTAKALGLNVPSSLLLRADEVIE